ncbi:MAG TPA: TraR/DksA C4-type zinc finger protein [Coriobacteriia bacterium]
MNVDKIAEVRSFLEAERTRLQQEIADFEREGQDNLSEASGENNYRDHMADQGSATFSRELDLSLEDNIRSMLVSVERAIKRIDDGVYGKCVRCGDEIAGARLEAMPTAELCISCKEWEEGR